MRETIILIGGGGHCRACIDVIEQNAVFQVVGIVDRPDRVGQKVLGCAIIASDKDIEGLVKINQNFIITIGQIMDPSKRINKYTQIKQLAGNFPVIISPKAYVSKYADVGEGTLIMHGSIVNAKAKIGVNCIINTNAVIEHDVIIEDHCHISTKAVINGECRIGKGTFIGSGSILSHCVSIPDNTIIGAGSLVLKSIQDSGIYGGNPLRKLSNFPAD